jgi:hypothetical protein
MLGAAHTAASTGDAVAARVITVAVAIVVVVEPVVAHRGRILRRS